MTITYGHVRADAPGAPEIFHSEEPRLGADGIGAIALAGVGLPVTTAAEQGRDTKRVEKAPPTEQDFDTEVRNLLAAFDDDMLVKHSFRAWGVFGGPINRIATCMLVYGIGASSAAQNSVLWDIMLTYDAANGYQDKMMTIRDSIAAHIGVLKTLRSETAAGIGTSRLGRNFY